MNFYPNVYAYEKMGGRQPAELRKRLYGVEDDAEKSRIIADYFKEQQWKHQTGIDSTALEAYLESENSPQQPSSTE